MNTISGLFAVGFCAVFLNTAATAETVRIGGTGAVTALLKQLEEPFARFSPEDRLEVVPGLGSSGGIAAVEAGAIEIGVSGRPLNEKEIAARMATRPFLETPFVFGAGVSSPVSLKSSDLLKIYHGDLQTYPNGDALRLILRPRGDAQTLLMIRGIEGMGPALEKARLRHDLPIAGNDQDNMELARKLPGAFSGFSLTQLLTEPNNLQHAKLDDAAPTLAAMRSGFYPIKLRIDFVHGPKLTPGAARFFNFVASEDAGAIIERNGGLRLR